MKSPGEYLAIPVEYGRWLGGLRWAESGEAVEFISEDPEVGLTFAMAREIGLFLRGFHEVRSPVPFAYVLHMFWLLGAGTAPSSAPPGDLSRRRRLANAFLEAKRPLANAGALLASLARDVPRDVDPPGLNELDSYLRWGPADPQGVPPRQPVELPSLEPEQFQDRIVRGLDRLTDDELQHWLRHGRGPIDEVGERIAREAQAARSLSFPDVLDAVAQRPRLDRTAPLVDHFAGALALPVRPRHETALPAGGYADITTRGRPEQILPSQLALDNLEFLRRFAAGELLYFQREQPRASAEEVVVIVVDQGVRTWGDVRLFLAAAALALLKQLMTKGVSVQITTTAARGQLHSVAEAGARTLVSLLEASDLSPHPALALQAVLETPEDRLRDVILLTHPRSLRDDDVAAAARTIPPGTRLFGVTADASGISELAELRHGTPIVLSSCRVTLPAPPQTVVRAVAPDAWRGEVEPIGFPFRMRVIVPLDPIHFTFDFAGEWLLAAGTGGILHAWRIESDHSEILPRPMLEDKPLTHVTALVGVAGGFIVGYQIGETLAAAHYHFGERICTVHRLGPPPAGPKRDSQDALEWVYHRALHALIVRNQFDRSLAHAIDLGADKNFACFRHHDAESHVAKRAKVAASQAAAQPPPRLPVVGPGSGLPSSDWWISLNPADGNVDASTSTQKWLKIRPLIDGHPALERGRIREARASADTLTFLAESVGRKVAYYVYRSTDTAGHTCTAVYEGNFNERTYALSPDGRRIARRLWQFQIEVRDVGKIGPPVLTTSRTKYHTQLSVGLGDSCMLIRTGKYFHIVRWDGSELTIAETQDELDARHRVGGLIVKDSARLRTSTIYDSRRFHSVCHTGRLTAYVDLYSHVVLTSASGVLAAIFFAFRNEVAVWLPDGTRWGPHHLIGGPTTPNATVRVAEAIRAAASESNPSTRSL